MTRPLCVKRLFELSSLVVDSTWDRAGWLQDGYPMTETRVSGRRSGDVDATGARMPKSATSSPASGMTTARRFAKWS